MSVDDIGEVTHYISPSVLVRHTEQIRRIVDQVGALDANQPIVINVQLPSETSTAVAGHDSDRRSIDWTAVIIFGLPTLLVLVISSFIFVGCMTYTPPPQPNITKHMENCYAACG
jgi:hypothetical protein